MRDSEQSVDEDGPAVEGTRLPFWKGLDTLYVLIAVGAPLTLLAAAYHVVQIVRGRADLIDIATAGYVVAAIVALIFLGLLRMQLQSSVIQSACPRCGFRSTRSFRVPDDKNFSPPSCGACIAYLRLDGSLVREQPSSATYAVPCFDVKVERYASVARRDARGYYEVPMPGICAVCGAANAREHRDISSPAPTSFGVVDTVASEYVKAHRQGALKPYGSHLSAGGHQEIYLGCMRIPVCARHTLDADPWNVGAVYETDVLRFQNYGFYKQFLALNHIDGPGAT